jgi:L-malate glycosyltransferase
LSVGSQLSAVEAGVMQTNARVCAGASTLAVCHIASGDRWAGAEVQVSALLKGLQRIGDLSLYAIFLNEGRLATETRDLGIDVCVLDESRQNFFEILSGASHFFKGKNVRVLHSHRYKENLLAAMLARKCQGAIHISSQHGAAEPFKGWGGLKQSAIHALDRQVAIRRTDRIISVSDELRMQLIRGILAEKVVTIHNGIDEDRVFSRLTTAAAKQRLGIAPDCPVVGLAGRLEPIKRLDIFLAAARRIAKELPNARFVIAGGGSETARLRQLTSTIGLDEHVLFLGHREDIYDVIRALDIFVFCSDHEGLPMALLETLYLGVPVVARPVGGIAEVIQDGVNGVCVGSSDPNELASACLSLLGDDSRRSALARAGATLVAENFTARHTAEQTAALYRSRSSACQQ